MHFDSVGTFAALHQHLGWPWIALDPHGSRLAFASSTGGFETRRIEDGRLVSGPTFALPADLALPTTAPPPEGRASADPGVRGFAINTTGDAIAIAAVVASTSVVVTVIESGELLRSDVLAIFGGVFDPYAITFDRSGTRLWISAESHDETAIALIDARTHAVVGLVRSARLPQPSLHELYVHPQDDAVLLLAACGPHGTFARIAGWSDGPPLAVPTALDGGSLPAGFVGFSADGARVHLVEADALRTHAWPGLEELSSVELEDDFISSFAGAVLGNRIFIDGEDAETGEDAVMVFDRSALRGSIVKPPVPRGMWAGRIGADAIVTLESKGDPAPGSVLRLPAPAN